MQHWQDFMNRPQSSFVYYIVVYNFCSWTYCNNLEVYFHNWILCDPWRMLVQGNVLQTEISSIRCPHLLCRVCFAVNLRSQLPKGASSLYWGQLRTSVYFIKVPDKFLSGFGSCLHCKWFHHCGVSGANGSGEISCLHVCLTLPAVKHWVRTNQ